MTTSCQTYPFFSSYKRATFAVRNSFYAKDVRQSGFEYLLILFIPSET